MKRKLYSIFYYTYNIKMGENHFISSFYSVSSICFLFSVLNMSILIIFFRFFQISVTKELFLGIFLAPWLSGLILFFIRDGKNKHHQALILDEAPSNFYNRFLLISIGVFISSILLIICSTFI